MILQHSFESSRKLFEYALCKSSSFSPELRSSKGYDSNRPQKSHEREEEGKEENRGEKRLAIPINFIFPTHSLRRFNLVASFSKIHINNNMKNLFIMVKWK